MVAPSCCLSKGANYNARDATCLIFYYQHVKDGSLRCTILCCPIYSLCNVAKNTELRDVVVFCTCMVLNKRKGCRFKFNCCMYEISFKVKYFQRFPVTSNKCLKRGRLKENFNPRHLGRRISRTITMYFTLSEKYLKEIKKCIFKYSSPGLIQTLKKKISSVKSVI